MDDISSSGGLISAGPNMVAKLRISIYTQNNKQYTGTDELHYASHTEHLVDSNISQVLLLVMDGYPTRLSGSGQISTIRRNPTPVGLHVTRRIGLAPITASTSVIQFTAAAIWFAACVEWLANYSNIPSRQVHPLIGLHVTTRPRRKVSRILYLRLMFVSRKLSHNRQFIRRPA